MEIHKILESQYEALDEIIDEVAERIRKIGHYAQGRLKILFNKVNWLNNLIPMIKRNN